MTADGRAVTVVVNALPGAIISKQSSLEAMKKEFMNKHEQVMNLVDTAICK